MPQTPPHKKHQQQGTYVQHKHKTITGNRHAPSPSRPLLYIFLGGMTFFACAHMWHATQLLCDSCPHVTCYATVAWLLRTFDMPVDMLRTCCVTFAHMWHATQLLCDSCSLAHMWHATRMLPKTFVESLRHHTDQAWTRKNADWQHRCNLQKCQNHGKYHCFFDTPWCWLTKLTQCSRIDRHKHVEKCWFSSSSSSPSSSSSSSSPSPSRTSSNKKNPEHDAVLARTYFKYVRAQKKSLLTCDVTKPKQWNLPKIWHFDHNKAVMFVREPQARTDRR